MVICNPIETVEDNLSMQLGREEAAFVFQVPQ